MLTRTFFARPPFTAGRFAPLPAGAISARGDMRERLITLRAELLSRCASLFPEAGEGSAWLGGPLPGGMLLPSVLEASLLTASLLGDDELLRDALRLCDGVIEAQREDGSFGAQGESFAARGRMLRAIACAYTASGERRLLTFMLRYMKYLSSALKDEPLQARDAMHIADTLEAGMFLYNVTGQRAILPVLNLLVSQGADYTSLFHAFPYRTPVSRTHTEATIRESIAAEDEDGYFHHLLRTADGANLCEGLRASGFCGMMTGSGKQLSAPEAGLTRLNRAHGAACGGVTADPLLAGQHPSRGVSALSLGELATSLEALFSCPDGENGADQLETLVYNAVAAAIAPDFRGVQRVQQANQLAVDGAARFPLLEGGSSLFRHDDAEAIAALAGAWPRFAQHQWMLTRDDGLCAMGYAPCAVRYRLGGVGVRATVESDYPRGGHVRITLNLERDTAFPLVLRIPAWARGATVAAGGEIVQAQAGTLLTLNRQWRDGDALLLTLPMAVETLPCFHQAVCVARGPLRFAYAPKAVSGPDSLRADGAFGVALVDGAPIEAVCADGRVTLTAQAVSVASWGMRGPSADQPPIVTGQDSGDPFPISLVPYAESPIRLSVLPVVSK